MILAALPWRCLAALSVRATEEPADAYPPNLPASTTDPWRDRGALDERAFNHAVRVLRLKRRAAAAVRWPGRGLCGKAGGHRQACGPGPEVSVRRFEDVESPLRVVLVQGVARGEKTDFILQKAVELGGGLPAGVHRSWRESICRASGWSGAFSIGAALSSAPASSAGAIACQTAYTAAAGCGLRLAAEPGLRLLLIRWLNRACGP